MRRLCIGDIHGCYDKMMSALDNCKYSDTDILYSVGDLCDRGKQNVKTLNFLMSLKNFKPVCGNHDWWNFSYLHPIIEYPELPRLNGKIQHSYFMSRDAWECWYYYNGGRNTVDEEHNQTDEWGNKVYNFLKNIPYLIDLGDKVIVHSVFPKNLLSQINTPLEKITMESLMTSGLMTDEVYDSNLWNRNILAGCEGIQAIGSKNIYTPYSRDKYLKEYNGSKTYIIGHTPLDHPFYDKGMGIIGIDTGGFCSKEKYGVDGYITVLDIDSFEYWTSKNYDIQSL